MTVFDTLTEGAVIRISEIKSCCVALNQSLNDCRIHLCSTHLFALESLVGALSHYCRGEAFNKSERTGLHPSGKASVPSQSDPSLDSQMGESLIALTHPPALSVPHLSREGSPHQGAEKETWAGSFGLKMRWEWVNCAVRLMLKDYSSVQRAAAALCTGSPRKSIPEQCLGWRLETEGTWRICTTPSMEKTFNLRKIRLSQLPLTRVPV